MNMSALKSVVIAFPKGFSKSSTIVPTNELVRSVSKFNFSTSYLTNKTDMDITMKIPKQEELQEDGTFFKPDVCNGRGKKRRLDHLTWEEKLQRKKLKNRVAAQTSRDRKKAKLDELEETVRILKQRNDVLSQECTILKSQNELLVSEAKKLRRERETSNMSEQLCSSCQARVSCPVPSLGSAVSPQNPLPQGGTVQSMSSLTLTPGATILLKIMTLYLLSKNYLEISKGMITSTDSKNLRKAFFEKLPQKWKQILIDQMNKYYKKRNVHPFLVSAEGNTLKKSDNTERMVGETSKNVEADTIDDRSLNGSNSWHSKCSADVAQIVPDNSRTTPIVIKNEIDVKQEPDINDMETVYGTYDETTNSITFIYPGQEDNIAIQECVEEISSSDNAYHVDDVTSMTMHLSCSDQYSPAYTCTDTMSPSSIYSDNVDASFSSSKSDAHFSDGGYESHGSPSPDIHKNNNNKNSSNKHNICLTDTWHESFTELFPMLL
ncbi:hypothetical protein M0804_004316 [Polistes exclamans]|nr:hypothetical protein M0804_004316 [Polistes exclamans]